MSFGAKAGIAVGVIAGFRCRLPAQVVWRNKRKGTELQSRGSDENAEYYSKPQGIEVAQPYQDDFAHSGCDQVRDEGGQWTAGIQGTRCCARGVGPNASKA